MKRFSASIAASAILISSLIFIYILSKIFVPQRVFIPAPGVPLHTMRFEMPLARENYNVTIRVGAMDVPGDEIDFCVKAEGRRLVFYVPGFDLSRMNEGPETTDGIRTVVGSSGLRRFEFTFSVNVRTPGIDRDGNTAGRVLLKPGEEDHPRWDDVLSIDDLSFTPADGRPLVPLSYSIDVAPDASMPVVYLAGDSTVTDQKNEPWATWGMMIPAFFDQGTAVANHAESGLALSSFVAHRRLEKILSTMKAGDYVLIQFGHNDQKETGPEAGANKGYSKRLAAFIDEVKAKGAHPVVVTPVERRRFRDGTPYGTLQDYAAAAKKVAAEKNVPVIDLNSMSLKFYEALGEEGSKNAFVHYPANTFPNQPQALKDDTHHNPYGGFELAKCVVQGIRDNVPELAKRLRPGIPEFDPANPDDFSSFRLPSAGGSSAKKPDGL